jgi:hypothetical protein
MNPEKLKRLDALVAKTITGVILKERKPGVRSSVQAQLFLVFGDGTYMELWTTSDEIWPAGPHGGGRAAAEDYCADSMHIVHTTFKDEP